MRNFIYFLFLIAFSVAIVGCSKEKKDEAAQLEKELMGDSSSMVDSMMQDSAMSTMPDSSAMMEEEEKVVEEPTKLMPKKPAGDGYTVQVAGCESRDYAHHLVEVYKKRGYEPFVTSITVENQGFYRVRIGIFANYAEAKSLQVELNDKYSVDAWIDVTVNNF